MGTLKEKYWVNGNVFRLSTGKWRLVWGDKAIDKGGYISKYMFNDELVNTDSTIGEHVIEVYSPNLDATFLDDLFSIDVKRCIWKKYRYVFSKDEAKEYLGVPDNEEFIIIG